jgi:hypothetical protein
MRLDLTIMKYNHKSKKPGSLDSAGFFFAKENFPCPREV